MSSCIIITEIDDDLPKFATIKNIFLVNSKIILDVIAFRTLSFCLHYHAYEVKQTTQSHTILLNKLPCIHTEILRCIGHKQYIVLRHHLVGIV